MIWWDGVRDARVLEYNDDAILLERATADRSLVAMAQEGDDGAASLIATEIPGKANR
ncbi:hypothetical protein EH240_30000 [Mesorhizobium tamadayense]|uniref:Uncharacterized protein n=1 Tax=Mesorhizobium tamadayense TaxID=425306 RepID=A0A3P3F3H3_9HYPH|nr:hypothetical protein EH240_30000 [Mesorhizobium tamadayense]